jgi:hypothetical protein
MVTIPTEFCDLEKLSNDEWKPADLSHLEYVAVRLLTIRHEQGWIIFDVIEGDDSTRGSYRCRAFERLSNGHGKPAHESLSESR